MSEQPLKKHCKTPNCQIRYLYHIADIHICAQNYKHIEYAWVLLLSDICKMENYAKKSILVIAGDVFDHKTYLKSEDIALFHEMMLQLEMKQIHTIIIPGNHDYNNNNNHINNNNNSNNNNGGNSNFNGDMIGALMKNSLYKFVHYFAKSSVQVVNDQIAFFIHSPIDNQSPKPLSPEHDHFVKVAISHQSLLYVKETKSFNSDAFHDVFDITLLGDIHKPQLVCNNVAYCGSFVQKDRGEGLEHGYYLWELNGKVFSESFVNIKQLSYWIKFNIKDNKPDETMQTWLEKTKNNIRGAQLYHVNCSSEFVTKYTEFLQETYQIHLDGIYSRDVYSKFLEEGGKGEEEEEENKKPNHENMKENDIAALIEHELTLDKNVPKDQKEEIMDMHQTLFGATMLTPTKNYDINCMIWSGLYCYTEDDVNYIDFNSFHNLNSILGNNFVGKSLVLSILSLLLFNKVSKGSKKHVIRKGSTTGEAWAKCILTSNNTDEYVIERYWCKSKDNTNVQTKIRLLKNNQDITGTTLAETYKFLQENVTGSYLVFKDTVFALQDRKSIIDIDRNECYELFCRAIDLERLKASEKENHHLLTLIKKQLMPKSNNKENIYQLEPLKKELQIKKANLSILFDSKQEVQAELESVKNSIENIQHQLFSINGFSLEQVQEEIFKSNFIETQKYPETKEQYNNLLEIDKYVQKCIFLLEQHTDVEFGENNEQSDTLIVEDVDYYIRLFSNLQHYLNDCDLEKATIKEINQHKTKIQDFQQELSEVETQLKKLKDLPSKTGFAKDKEHSLPLQVAGNRAIIQEATRIQNEISSTKCKHCASCRQNCMYNLFTSITNSIGEAKKELALQMVEYEKIVDHKEEANTFEKQQDRTKLQLTQEFDLLVKKVEEHFKTEDILKDTLSKIEVSKQKSYETLLFPNNLKNLYKTKDIIQAQLKQHQNRENYFLWQSRLTEAKQHNQMKLEFKELSKKSKTISLKMETLISQHDSLKMEVFVLEEKCKTLEAQSIEKKSFMKEFTNRTLYEKLINSKTGLPFKMITQLISKIQDDCNSIFKDMDEKFMLRIEYTKKGIELFIVSNGSIIDEKKSSWIPAQQASGYQKFLTDIIIRKVLCSIVACGIPSILFIDEGFRSADKQHFEILCTQVLPKLASQFKKVIVISHSKKIHNFTTCSCTIQVTDGVSKLTFGQYPKLQWLELGFGKNQQITENEQTALSKSKKQKKSLFNKESEPFFVAVEDDSKIYCQMCQKLFSINNLKNHRKTQMHEKALNMA